MTIYYGNTYLYCDLSLYFILGTLFVFRNSLQGIGKSLYPLLAGIAELIARTAICLILPPILNNGPISVDANNKAIFGLTFADPLAWSFAVIILTIGIVKYICKNDKKVKTIAYESGFHNVDYFCRLFKKRYHLTPSEYRCTCLKVLSADPSL